MRVVFDTNVLISALLWPTGTAARAVAPARHGQVQALISPPLLQELRRILEEKFDLEPDILEVTVELVSDFSETVMPSQTIRAVTEDEDDNRVLECAVEGKAELIVTGDRHLLKLNSFRGIDILTPAIFLQKLGR